MRAPHNNENHPRRSLCSHRIQRFGFWHRGGVVAVPAGNGGWNSVPVVGHRRFQGSESKSLLELFELAHSRGHCDRCDATLFWGYALPVSHAARTAQVWHLSAAVFSAGTIVPGPCGSFSIGVVPDADVLWRLFAGHRSTLHIRGDNLLASPATLRRRSLWTIRKSQSFRRIRRAYVAGWPGDADFSRVTAGPIPARGALILSGSRGGIVSFGFEVAVLWLLAKTRKGPEGPRLTALAIVALAAVALIAWLGAGKAIERFSMVRSGEVTIDRRFTMSQGAAHIFKDHPVEGAGLGALVAIYPRYEILYDGRLVDHVHNDYIEMLAETGVLGGLCGLAFFWILFREAKTCYGAEQGHFSRALHAGAVTGLCGMLLHSFVDFNLHIPANALLFLLQAYLATSTPLSSESVPARRRSGTRKLTVAAEV